MLIISPKVLAMMVTNQRKQLKLSQAEIAKRIGLRQQTISDFENNPANTRLDTLFRILSAVNLDLSLSAKDSSTTGEATSNEGW